MGTLAIARRARAKAHTPEMAAESKATHGELRQAVRDLQNRGLLHSARWAAEQLYGLADEEPGGEDEAGRGFAPSTPAPPADDDAMEMETPASVVRPRDGARVPRVR